MKQACRQLGEDRARFRTVAAETRPGRGQLGALPLAKRYGHRIEVSLDAGGMPPGAFGPSLSTSLAVAAAT